MPIQLRPPRFALCLAPASIVALVSLAARAQDAKSAPEPTPYAAKPPGKSSAKAVPAHGRRLTLGELWERARRLGPPSTAESTAIVRQLRDERYSR